MSSMSGFPGCTHHSELTAQLTDPGRVWSIRSVLDSRRTHGCGLIRTLPARRGRGQETTRWSNRWETCPSLLLWMETDQNRGRPTVRAPGFGVGAYIVLAGLWASPVSGASMNPARSFGPDIVRGDVGGLWIYLLGPAAGTLVAVGAAYILRGPGGGTAASKAARGTLTTFIAKKP